MAVIKALGAVAPAIVSRGVYYPGAKHLVPILQLLIPGIDLVRYIRLSVQAYLLIMSSERSSEDGELDHVGNSSSINATSLALHHSFLGRDFSVHQDWRSDRL